MKKTHFWCLCEGMLTGTACGTIAALVCPEHSFCFVMCGIIGWTIAAVGESLQ